VDSFREREDSIRVAGGTLIYREGEEGVDAYFIEDGEVEIFTQGRQGQVTLARLTTGDIFGEMALIDNKPRSASVRTTRDSRLRPISQRRVRQIMTEADPAVRRFVDVLVDRLRQTNKQLATYRAPGAEEEARQS
jgi:CRP-like cAMP-binding protein